MSAQLLIIIESKSEHLNNSLDVEEALDAALGVAGFGVSVAVAFVGFCVQFVFGKHQLKIIPALDYYDIQSIYVLDSDIKQYYPELPESEIECQTLADADFALLFSQYDQILRMS